MFPMTPIAMALALVFCANALAVAADSGLTPRSLLAQSKGLPREFEEHFFDVPLAVRVELDQQFLGEAMVVLSRDDRITLVDFTEVSGSKIKSVERDTWSTYLKQGIALGACQTKCPEQLLAVYYSLENSMLSILTENVERDDQARRFYHLPQGGSSGLIVRNQLNLNGGQHQDLGGRYGLQASGSLGNWSQSVNLQLSRTGGIDNQVNHAVHDLYTQRELEGNFVRLGYFTPTSEGLSRQPRTFGASPDTALGVMYGSSDSLVINNPKPSIYPIYVTANRQGSVETGLDLQGMYAYGRGSIVASHNRSWLDTTRLYDTLPDGTRSRQRHVFVGQTRHSSLALNHRLTPKSSVNARFSHSQGNTVGTGVDLGWTQRTQLFGNDANWRFSLFDRPGSYSAGNGRDRGIDISLNLALGGPEEQLTGSIGSRTARNGGNDHNASLTYRKSLQDHLLQSVSATATTDTYGVGLSAMATLHSDRVSGDGFLQRPSYNNDLTGGLNLDSTVAIGARKMVMTSQAHRDGAGMIIDVESDIDGIALRADDLSGGSAVLRPGRNFVPLTAFKSSSVHFDFEGNHVPAASIQTRLQQRRQHRVRQGQHPRNHLRRRW